MFGTILQRAIFLELVVVFLLSLGSLTGMFLLGGLVQEATQRGLNPTQVLAAIPLLIPSTLPYTVPATTLFAVCVVYGRMANDNEIVALRAAGVHLGRLLAPALWLGGITGVGTFALLVDFVPRTHGMLTTAFIRDLDSVLYGMLRRDGCVRHPSLDYSIYVREVHGKRLVDPIFKRLTPDRKGYSMVARAKEATLWTDPEAEKVLIYMPLCSIAGDSGGGSVQGRVFEMPLPLSKLQTPNGRAMDMTWRQTLDKQRGHQASLDGRRTEIAELERAAADATLPKADAEKVKQQLAGLRYDDKQDRKQIARMRAERHGRVCLAVGCLAFVMAGLPVGIWMSKADYLSAFVSCFLPVVFAYYPLMLCGQNFAREGKLPSFPAVWVANIVVGGAGVWMIRRLVRR